MFASTKLAVYYTVFGLIASAANITAQDIFIHIYHGAYDILASVIVGTGVGLVVKYILDKRYIFRFRARSIAHDTRTFVLYTLVGVATTLEFWTMEFGFQYIFRTKEMRYVGAAIGLAIGYLIKYQLDKRFTFRLDFA